MTDPELDAAKKRDDYERAEGLPLKFHAWGLLNKRVLAAAKEVDEKRKAAERQREEGS